MPQVHHWLETVAPLSPVVIQILGVILRLVVSVHVVLTKRSPRAAIAWVGLVLVAPFAGSAFYLVFGINRIHRKARTLRRGLLRREPGDPCKDDLTVLRGKLGPAQAALFPLARLVGEVTDTPLTAGNRIVPLVDGDETYPAMLEAIASARQSIALSTYIFYDDPLGRRFVEALGAAVTRGVEVRVLIDDLGARYGWRRTIVGPLREAGVVVSTFIPTMAPGWIPFINLRNHRKLLIIDGGSGFTGGMNIDATFVHHDAEILARTPDKRHRHHDLHFRIDGPVVSELLEVFADDWEFTTGEVLDGPCWFPEIDPAGPSLARCVSDGPDEDLDPLEKTFLGAIAAARHSIILMTPYFLPDDELLSALEVASLRGVRVEVLVPRRSNLRFVEWAMPPFLERVLERGCHVRRTPPPFDHTKLMVVDDAWVFLGSANLDARSLRLNFEVNVEAYGAEVAGAVRPFVEAKVAAADPLSLADLRSRPKPQQLRDNAFRLLAPYL